MSKKHKELLVGFTATPERSDKLGLLYVFEKITYTKSISEMIDDAWQRPHL